MGSPQKVEKQRSRLARSDTDYGESEDLTGISFNLKS